MEITVIVDKMINIHQVLLKPVVNSKGRFEKGEGMIKEKLPASLYSDNRAFSRIVIKTKMN
jgi:hypothetical protein